MGFTCHAGNIQVIHGMVKQTGKNYGFVDTAVSLIGRTCRIGVRLVSYILRISYRPLTSRHSQFRQQIGYVRSSEGSTNRRASLHVVERFEVLTAPLTGGAAPACGRRRVRSTNKPITVLVAIDNAAAVQNILYQ